MKKWYIPTDIPLHFFAGWIACSFTDLWVLPQICAAGESNGLSIAVIGVAVAFIVGVFKELYDWKIKKTSFSAGDLAMTWLGGLAYFFTLVITQMIVR